MLCTHDQQITPLPPLKCQFFFSPKKSRAYLKKRSHPLGIRAPFRLARRGQAQQGHSLPSSDLELGDLWALEGQVSDPLGLSVPIESCEAALDDDEVSGDQRKKAEDDRKTWEKA